MKFLGYGDNVVDRYVNKNKYFPGGNAINFAVYAAKLGAESAYLGMFGDDAEAEHIKATLSEFGIDTGRCQTEKDSATERCDVELIDGDRVFVADDMRDNLHGILPLDVGLLEYINGFAMIHAACYGTIESELPKLDGCRAVVSFDFSVEDEYRSDEYLQTVCPHLDLALFSCEGLEYDEIKALADKARALGTAYVLCTMGIHGQYLFGAEGERRGKVELVDAVDTMGAGDSFYTAFAVTLLRAGWRKGEKITDDQAQQAFNTAAAFSAKVCLDEGAFGHSKNIK